MAIKNQIGDGCNYGLLTGKTVGQFICELFGKQLTEKRQDEVLSNILRAEFPHGAKDYFKNIKYYRNLYNRGSWPPQCKRAPKVPIPQFDSCGFIVTQKDGFPPRPAGSKPVPRLKKKAKK